MLPVRTCWDEPSSPSTRGLEQRAEQSVLQRRPEAAMPSWPVKDSPKVEGNKPGMLYNRLRALEKDIADRNDEVSKLSGELKTEAEQTQKLKDECQQLNNTVDEQKQRERALEQGAEQLKADKQELTVRLDGTEDPNAVRQEIFGVFDNELAKRASAAPDSAGAICLGQEGFDAGAMTKAGMPDHEIAEQYISHMNVLAVRDASAEVGKAGEKFKQERRRRRLLQDQLQELKGSIRVMVRVRPLAAHEGLGAVAVHNNTEVVLTKSGRDGRKTFAVDHAFGVHEKQADVFSEVEPVLESVLAGFNVCIFAYGQTGSGKTFTMEGSRTDPVNAGLNPRALAQLFELCAEAEGDGWQYELAISFLEIYNENLRDLLDSSTGIGVKEKKIDVRSLGDGGVSVPGLTVQPVKDISEVHTVLHKGSSRRSVAATKMNAASSRSHSIVMVTVTGKNATTGATTYGKISLIDLAGSERVKKSEVTGQGLIEAQHINKSLSALSNVINSLQAKDKHIPFRDSKLTHLLADSLGGNSKTFMFVNINPAAESIEESLCSLKFAERAGKVELGKASGKRVEGASVQELKDARDATDRARGENNELKRKFIELETRSSELQLETRLGSEREAQLESELKHERESATQYRDTEESLCEQTDKRQKLQLDAERKRREDVEARLVQSEARLRDERARVKELEEAVQQHSMSSSSESRLTAMHKAAVQNVAKLQMDKPPSQAQASIPVPAPVLPPVMEQPTSLLDDPIQECDEPVLMPHPRMGSAQSKTSWTPVSLRHQAAVAPDVAASSKRVGFSLPPSTLRPQIPDGIPSKQASHFVPGEKENGEAANLASSADSALFKPAGVEEPAPYQFLQAPMSRRASRVPVTQPPRAVARDTPSGPRRSSICRQSVDSSRRASVSANSRNEAQARDSRAGRAGKVANRRTSMCFGK